MLAQLPVIAAVVHLEHRLLIYVANDVLSFAILATKRYFAARHDGNFIPPRASRWAHGLSCDRGIDLSRPIFSALHEAFEKRITLGKKFSKFLIPRGAINDP
jgi:hypothetical protein